MNKGQEEYILMNNGVVAEHHVMLELREGGKTPTQEEIDAAVIRVQAEFDASQYARKRKAEYPDWGTQLNKIYDAGLTKWKAEMVDPIKAKWPKDTSGPV